MMGCLCITAWVQRITDIACSAQSSLEVLLQMTLPSEARRRADFERVFSVVAPKLWDPLTREIHLSLFTVPTVENFFVSFGHCSPPLFLVLFEFYQIIIFNIPLNCVSVSMLLVFLHSLRWGLWWGLTGLLWPPVEDGRGKVTRSRFRNSLRFGDGVWGGWAPRFHLHKCPFPPRGTDLCGLEMRCNSRGRWHPLLWLDGKAM